MAPPYFGPEAERRFEGRRELPAGIVVLCPIEVNIAQQLVEITAKFEPALRRVADAARASEFAISNSKFRV
jgi:hypothetical protein